MFQEAKKASSKAEVVGLINDFDLPREVRPPQWLNELAVWEALLPRIPLTAPGRTPARWGRSAW
jgi:hypothetical protein